MNNSVAIGNHNAWRDGDVMRVALRGLITIPELQTLHDLIKRWREEHNVQYAIYDMRHMLPLEPHVRKWITQNFQTGVWRANLLLGASPVVRLLITALQEAMALAGTRSESPVVMAKTEEQALAWIEQDRARR